MAARVFDIPGVGEVSFRRRKGSRHVRLKVDLHGKAIVTMPYLVPYRTAIHFATQHVDWIREEQAKRTGILPDGLRVGRVHVLRYELDAEVIAPKARVSAHKITIRHRSEVTDPAVQRAARQAVVRALKREAEHFLPKRLRDIAASEGYTYSGVAVKQMRTRWGSCNQDQFITLNIFLMQLPVELIDYVIYHELAHTRALHHGPDFWAEFEAHLPNARDLRSRIRGYQPAINPLRA